jgi:hypothetical protein
MPEGLNAEVAHHLTEKGGEASEAEESRSLEIHEIVEAVLLALVAIATAWSGYQAAQWDSKTALYYGQSSKDRLLATRQTNLSGQYLLYNATTFNAWGASTTAGNAKLAAFYVKRFTPDYRVAFDAWLKTDPAHNPKAPPGPSFMPQYHNPAVAQAKRLDDIATATFQHGTDASETADKYVRSTVLFATILFLIAIGQRFEVKVVRRTLLGIALVLLTYGLITLTTYPRA